MTLQRTATSTPAFWLGLAACMCNLLVVLLPIGLVLGIVALAAGLLGSTRGTRASGGNVPALALAGVSFLIALIWAFSVAAIFAIDPTLL